MTLNQQGRVMTEAATETGSAHPSRYRDRDRMPRAATAVWLTRYADLASTRAARPMRAARRWGHRLPPVVWDWLLPALLLLHIMTTHAPQELPVALTLTAAIALPLVWRRRAPLTTFGVVATAAFVQWLMDAQLPSYIALLVALYTVAAHSGRRGMLVAGAVVESGALLACLRWATEGAFLTPFVAVTAMVVAAAVLGANVRTTRAYLAALEERAARLEQQQDQQARLAVAEERTRITREMHDIVTHNLSVMVALTDAAVYAQHRSPAKATTAMLQISETGRQALTDMATLLGHPADRRARRGAPPAARHRATGGPGRPDVRRRAADPRRGSGRAHQQAVRLARDLRPDVVLMDVRMPGTDGIEATRQVIRVSPQSRVLILTTFDLDEYAFTALKAGASGFLLKNTRPEELLAAIHSVAAGDTVVSPRITRRLLENLRPHIPDGSGADRDERLSRLSGREREVLIKVGGGLSNTDIAAALYLAEATVKSHLGRILQKLELRDRIQAVIFAYESRLIHPA